MCFESQKPKNAVGKKASALAALSAAGPVFQKDQDGVKIGLKFLPYSAVHNLQKRDPRVNIPLRIGWWFGREKLRELGKAEMDSVARYDPASRSRFVARTSL